MDSHKYLERIGYKGNVTPTLQFLTDLQEHHLFSVPFENLDIHLGRAIDLENSYNKVVTQKRGGFCYELNGLFYHLLKRIGFEVDMVSARVYNKAKQIFPPEFDHLALVVHLGSVKYLVDVGNGEFAIHPLCIEMNTLQSDPRGKFRIKKHDDTYLQVSKLTDDTEGIEYIFTLQPRAINEFLPMLLHQQTSPDSHFSQKRLCTMPTEDGRITITGNILKIRKGSEVSEQSLASEEEFQKVLLDYFDLKM